MKLDKMIIAALHTSGVANGVLSLANQNQERELKKISDSVNKGENLHILDEFQPQKERHSKHRNERNIHQLASSFDEMQDADSRHPYSANSPAKKPIHKGRKSHIKLTATEFNKLKAIKKQRDTYLLTNYKDLMKELSTAFKKVTGEINTFREQSKKLQLTLVMKEKLPQHKYGINAIKADLNAINNNILPKLETERANIQSEIIKKKNSIELFVKEGKINFSQAEKFINEYTKLINNFDNKNNKKDISSKQRLSEKLTSVTTNNKGKKQRETSVIKRDRAISL